MLTVPPVLTIEPTNFAPGTTQQQPPLSLGTGTITAGPDRVWDLTRPVTLDGTWTNRDPSTGQISLQTAMGLLTLQTNADIPQGAQLSLQITPGDPPLVTLFAQGHGGQPAVPPAAIDTPAVVLTDGSLTIPALQPGQIITLIPVSDSAANGTAATPVQALEAQLQMPVQEATIAATATAATPGAAASASQSAIQTAGAPLPEIAQYSLAGGAPLAAAPSAVAGTNAQQPIVVVEATLPVAEPAGALPVVTAPIVQQAVQAAGAPQILPSPPVAQAGTPTTPSAAATPLQAAPIAGATILPARSFDFTGLSPALAAQIPTSGESEAAATAAALASGANPGTQADADPSVSVRILAILPPGAALQSPPPGTIVAAVEGSTLSQHLILETPAGRFAVQSQAALPPGTRLLIERTDQAPPQRAAAPAPLDTVAGKNWPALAAALQALDQSHPALADALRLAIPQEGPLLAPVLLLFVASLRRGDSSGWLGQAALGELRRNGQGQIASQLDSDFTRLARQSTATAQDGWHSIPVPLMAEGGLTGLQLHLRRYPPSDDEAESGTPESNQNSVRFLIDAEPSATGPIQLDGLVRQDKPAKAATLDLILRSQKPIAQNLRGDIARLFTDSLATTGLKGGLVFQGGANWVKIARERGSAPSLMA